MKKSILNLGKKLTKAEQTQINGGRKQCMKPGGTTCFDYGWFCAESECQIGPF
ncbi:hypothetical protein [Tenacibaculum caenipelagi]|uniref:Bacteriocin-like protein n=1 Tax=Tenacibaculum caenipelagi TaxID=1325435 RepID=A0A4R6TC58_9FLAO|nr:hypothetical protein [Tenacibaculum caenipelagi]TDQ23974.1 hypothetical protein DFQ07_2513 [Tenacibaculum caenipelagi]